MAIPLIVAGAVGLLGISGHLSAKETNEMAQRVSQEAKSMYDNAKSALESEQKMTEQSLLRLGRSKKRVMDNSIKQFLRAYDRIKDVQLSESIGLNELSKFSVDKQGALQLQKMSDVYSSSISSGAAGAAAGTLIALAASGGLPVVTGAFSIAGSALALGEFGAAAGIAGSALSFGAAMTPLSAIAAPVILFTGISASIKADENLEKANVMHAEAESACEKMKVSQTLCKAIQKRSDMYDKLLRDLDSMYRSCTVLLDRVTKNKVEISQGRTLTSADFTEEELKLIAVTRALTGAVKAVIDTPILSKDGSVSDESKTVYTNTTAAIPSFGSQVGEVKSYDYHLTPSSKKFQIVPNISEREMVSQKSTTNSDKGISIRNVFALSLGIGCIIYWEGSIWNNAVWGATIALLAMKIHKNSKFDCYAKNICLLIMAISFGGIFWTNRLSAIYEGYPLWSCIGIGGILFVIWVMAVGKCNDCTGNILKMVMRLSGCGCCYYIALAVLKVLCGFLNFPVFLVAVILEVLYVMGTLLLVFFPESI